MTRNDYLMTRNDYLKIASELQGNNKFLNKCNGDWQKMDFPPERIVEFWEKRTEIVRDVVKEYSALWEAPDPQHPIWETDIPKMLVFRNPNNWVVLQLYISWAQGFHDYHYAVSVGDELCVDAQGGLSIRNATPRMVKTPDSLTVLGEKALMRYAYLNMPQIVGESVL